MGLKIFEISHAQIIYQIIIIMNNNTYYYIYNCKI